jgi:transcription-repair coupling factor (superfamily II helicase)
VSLFGDEVDGIREFDPLTGEVTQELERVSVYANSHYVTPRPTLQQAIRSIKAELQERLRSSKPRAGCWRRSASGSAPPSTSRCSKPLAAARASRTTAAT